MALEEYYGREVIGGPGAFVEVADETGPFALAARRKLLPAAPGHPVPARAPRPPPPSAARAPSRGSPRAPSPFALAARRRPPTEVAGHPVPGRRFAAQSR